MPLPAVPVSQRWREMNGQDVQSEEPAPGSVSRLSQSRLSRRRFLQAGAATGLLAAGAGSLIERAASAAASAGSSLSDIEHVVFLMQENRSFDSYYGVMSGVRGYSDPHVLHQQVGGKRYPVFDQFGYQPGAGPSATGFLQPFHLENDPPAEDGEATNDITHAWAPQHQSWNEGAMDSFVTTHLANDGDSNGILTMGYFTQRELPFYYALADAFTICDHYFCSVLGPTDPNRVMSISATIDPAGAAGGPCVQTLTAGRPANYGQYTWETMAERLLAAGVSWKVYNDPTSLAYLSPWPYFKNYVDPAAPDFQALSSRAILPTYPGDFVADITAGALPQVSWIMSPLAECEHPAAPPHYGEYLAQQVLNALVSNPDVWASTVLFIMYDENGGFFDHVPPPTPAPGTAGEYLTVNPLPSAAAGIAGPVGLGFRVPCLVVSPFSAGGYLCTDVLDHTSQLRFLEARFGVEVPNLSAWRRSVTGTMAGALNLTSPPDTTVPALPATSLGNTTIAEEAVINALTGTEDVGEPYPPPLRNHMPRQATSPPRPKVPR